jgi:hypothetical protein
VAYLHHRRYRVRCGVEQALSERILETVHASWPIFPENWSQSAQHPKCSQAKVIVQVVAFGETLVKPVPRRFGSQFRGQLPVGGLPTSGPDDSHCHAVRTSRGLGTDSSAYPRTHGTDETLKHGR